MAEPPVPHHHRLRHLIVGLVVVVAILLGALAFAVIEPTLTGSRTLSPSSLITADPTLGPSIVPAEPTVEQTDAPALAALARHYQPTVVVSVGDRFWPVSVLPMLRLRWHRDVTCIVRDDRCVTRAPTPADLRPDGSRATDYLQYPAPLNNVQDQFLAAARALGVSVDAIARWTHTAALSNPFASAQVYFHYLRRSPRHAYHGLPKGLVSLQYWFFYALNYLPTVKTPTETLINPLGATIGNTDYHQGDLEHVAVLLDPRTFRPRYLWMARHGDEGVAYRWHSRSVQWAGDHPVVYAAFGSHATYAHCGIQRRERTFYVVNDYVVCIPHATFGFTYRATPLVDLRHTAWACWQGHLGEAGPHLDRGLVNFVPYESDGPRSPLLQQENLGTGCRSAAGG